MSLIARWTQDMILQTIYEQVYRNGSLVVIAYNKRNEPEIIRFDSHFAPLVLLTIKHLYRYDNYGTINYTRPKECADCPLAHDSLCQKGYKVKVTNHLRRYNASARGSTAWKTIYKRWTAVKHVIAYLKGFFQLNNICYRTGGRANLTARLFKHTA